MKTYNESKHVTFKEKLAVFGCIQHAWRQQFRRKIMSNSHNQHESKQFKIHVHTLYFQL